MKSAIAAVVLVVSLVFVASGCYRHSFRTGAMPRGVAPDAVTSNHHLFWGFANLSGDVHMGQYCPHGTAMVKNRVGALGVLVSIITGGIWVPTKIEIWCAGGHAEGAAAPPDAVASE